ncbi:MAG: DUF1616 domain-containing protein [Dehalococcoidales bacterium]|nr:DUF1616 domain-containing protein [Dehalococcoidales bacterium]
MKIRIRNELVLLNLLVLLLTAAIIFFPSNVVRIILGLPFIFFFPGYAMMTALFPRREGISSIERVVLSLGMSITVVPLMGLILNYTPWGIRLYPIVTSITTFILIMSIIAWYRRHKLAKGERFTISFNLSLSPWRGQNTADKVLSIVLIVAVLGAIGTVGYALVRPKVGENLTEFYVLDIEGKAANYPRQLAVGQEGKVIVGIVNSEHEVVSYRLEVMIDGVVNNDIGGIVLEQDEKWEQEVSFIPQKAGENQRVEFLLYKDGEVEPSLKPLRLWVDVTE